MAIGKKESQFTVKTTIVDSDLIRMLVPGQNLTISFSDFKLALGVTGELSQVGDPLGAPILDKTSPTQNNIRNLESSKGLQFNVSAQNGVVGSCNFSQGTVGEQIITNLNAEKYEFKTLQAGEGINITDTGGILKFDAISSSGTTKTVVISQESDFPDPVAGVITLADDTDYIIVSDVTTTNRFIVGRPTTVRASSSQLVKLSYTGTDAMFTGVNPNFKIIGLTTDCPNGSLYDMSTSGLPGIVQMVESNVESCDSLGVIDGNFVTRFTAVAFEDIKTTGLLLKGANDLLVIETGVAFLNGGILLDFGTSVFKSVSISGVVAPDSAPGSVFFSGLTNSGNIAVGGLGTIFNNKGFGSGTSLSGLSPEDARWNFSLNNTIPDTRPDALLSVEANTSETVIGTIDTPVIVNAVWTDERNSQHTSTVGGRTTYIGGKGFTAPITFSFSLLMASGGDKQVSAYIAINGVVKTQTKVTITSSSSKAGPGTCIWQQFMATGDFVEVFVENNSNTENIIVADAVLRIN